MFLLDTNVVSELRKAKVGRADANVVAWAAGAAASSMFISAITVQELEIGVLLAERRDPAQARFCAVGWKRRCCPRSPSEFFPSTPPLRDAAPSFTFPIRGPSVTR